MPSWKQLATCWSLHSSQGYRASPRYERLLPGTQHHSLGSRDLFCSSAKTPRLSQHAARHRCASAPVRSCLQSKPVRLCVTCLIALAKNQGIDERLPVEGGWNWTTAGPQVYRHVLKARTEGRFKQLQDEHSRETTEQCAQYADIEEFTWLLQPSDSRVVAWC